MKYKEKNLKGFGRGLIFTIIFCLIFAGFSNLFTPKADANTEGMSAMVTKAYLAEERDTIDVLFLGNSNMYRAFNPIQLWQEQGITSCDIGMPSSNTVELYRKAVDFMKYQKPKMIVVETDCMFDGVNVFDANGNLIVSKSTKIESKVKERMDAYKNSFDNLDDAIMSGISYRWPLMKYKYRWKRIKSRDFTDEKGKYKFVAKGYVNGVEKKPFKYGATYMGVNDGSTAKLSSNSDVYVKKLIELCKANNCQLMITSVPCGKYWNWQKHNAAQKFADENNIKFLDFNVETQLIPEFSWKNCSRDGGTHINGKGAKYITHAMGRYLVEQCDMKPSNLTAKQKAAWNKDVKSFNKVKKRQVKLYKERLKAQKLNSKKK